MKLIIDRNKWLRGEGDEDSYLLRSSDGKMCCLGFLAKECGHADCEISDVCAPPKIRNRKSKMNDLVEGSLPSGLCSELMMENDDQGKSDSYREMFIKEKLSELDIEVEFIN
jgi:hypothetical protein